MRNRLFSLLTLLPLLISFQIGCDALKGGSDKAKKEETEEEEDDDKKDKKKKKKKGDGDDAGSATAAASGTGAPTAAAGGADAPPLVDGPAPDKKKLAAFLKDEKAKLTADQFENALMTLADCRLETHGIDYQCDAYKDYQKAIGHPADLDDYKKRAEAAQKWVRHKSPTVRYEAIRKAYSGFGSGEGALKPILVACKAETEPQVVVSCVDSIGHSAKDKPEVKDFVFASLDHADDRVRDRAAQVLGSRLNQPIPGSYEKLAEKVEKDSTKKVKASACRALSAPEDPRALEVFEKLLESKKTDDEVRTACFDGLIRLWAGYSYPKKPNKDAYELTMKILEKTPRTEKSPPASLGELGSAKTEFKDFERSAKDWYKDAKDFYKKERLVKALEDIALDSDANSGARSSALYTLKSIGAKANLGTIATKLKTKTDSSSKYLSETASRLSKEKD